MSPLFWFALRRFDGLSAARITDKDALGDKEVV